MGNIVGYSIKDLGGADPWMVGSPDPWMVGSPDNVDPVTDEEISEDSTNKFKSKKKEGEIEKKDFSRVAGPDGPIKIGSPKKLFSNFS